jgi:hypothetical protein
LVALKIPFSQAVSLLLELGFENAKKWNDDADLKSVQETINTLHNVLDKDIIIKVKDIPNAIQLLSEILEKIKADEKIEVLAD